MCTELASGTPTPVRLNPLDLPDDYFRIRLVCNILETCGGCFDRGNAKKKLDFFLTFFQVCARHGALFQSNLFQYYVQTKQSLPMDVDFIIQDTFAFVRPQWKIATDFDEAGRLFADAVAANYKSEESEKLVEPEEAEDELSSEDVDGDDIPGPGIDEHQSSSEEAEVEVCS